MLQFIYDVGFWLAVIVALKAVIIGSDFDFSEWMKHGKHYLIWYRNRPKYVPPIKK